MPNKISLRKYTHRNSPLYIVNIGDLSLYFSYETVVAFRAPGHYRRVVCENVWSTTTGRHLNEIDGGDKECRLKYVDFNRELQKVLADLGLIV